MCLAECLVVLGFHFSLFPGNVDCPNCEASDHRRNVPAVCSALTLLVLLLKPEGELHMWTRISTVFDTAVADTLVTGIHSNMPPKACVEYLTRENNEPVTLCVKYRALQALASEAVHHAILAFWNM